jgi:hypothetical protein
MCHLPAALALRGGHISFCGCQTRHGGIAEGGAQQQQAYEFAADGHAAGIL